MDRKSPILLVEDDRIDILTVQRGFQKLKIENQLVVTHNGAEAFELLSKLDPEDCPGLILLDLNLPKMDGFQFLEKIKNTPILKRIPIIVVTTSQADRDIAICFDHHVAGYFVKPLDYFTLMDSIIQYWEYSKLPPLNQVI